MFKKIAFGVIATSLLLGSLQAGISLRHHLGDSLDKPNPGVSEIIIRYRTITEITSQEADLLAANYPNLKILHLPDNDIEKLPESIGKLKKLEHLSIAGNKLTTLPKSIGNLTNLTFLDIGLNPFTSLPSSLGNLTKLEEISLSALNLTQVPAWLRKLKKLRNLNLHENKLMRVPTWVVELPALVTLTITLNDILAADLHRLNAAAADLHRLSAANVKVLGIDTDLGRLDPEMVHRVDSQAEELLPWQRPGWTPSFQSPDEYATTHERLWSSSITTPEKPVVPVKLDPMVIDPATIPKETQCAICLGDEHLNYKTSCGHYFHADELSQWITGKPVPTCPQCRQDIFSGTPSRPASPERK